MLFYVCAHGRKNGTSGARIRISGSMAHDKGRLRWAHDGPFSFDEGSPTRPRVVCVGARWCLKSIYDSVQYPKRQFNCGVFYSRPLGHVVLGYVPRAHNVSPPPTLGQYSSASRTAYSLFALYSMAWALKSTDVCKSCTYSALFLLQCSAVHVFNNTSRLC